MMNRYTVLFILTAMFLLGAMRRSYAEPNMLVNSCVTVVDDHIKRWSEGSILPLNEKDILIAVTGYSGWNHDHSPADIYGLWSHDGGLSWTPREQAVLLQSSQSIGVQNVMSVSLLHTHAGDVLMSFFAYKKDSEWAGTYVKRSTDRCKTWSQPVLIDPEAVSMPGRMFQLKDGRIILPVGRKGGSGTLWSDDNGQTWNPSNKAREGLEPTVVPLKDGRLLMMMRMSRGQIYKSYSADRGERWSDIQPTGIPSPASMCTLMRLQNGDLMLVFNPARAEEVQGPWPRYKLAAMISRDEGMTWSNLRLLDGGDEYKDVCKITMASVAPLGKHRVIVVWSRSPKQSKDHYRNLYDYRVRVFNLDWLYAGDDLTVYKAPK